MNITPFTLHLAERGLKPWHNCWVDHENELVTFPLWTVDGKLIGYQRYNWRETKIRDNGARYFTWLDDAYKQVACYGIDNCCGHSPLFVTEGIWDALRVSNCYVDCLALLSCSPHRQLRQWLRMYAGNRPIIGLCDNDENKSGNRLISTVDIHYFPPYNRKDVNALTHDECFSWITTILQRVRFGDDPSTGKSRSPNGR
jgi:hypothetical protein